ncbi:unnamed protein product [Phytophthora fragariaefolia]|uniref:Unnamed protein product n=1 Tax=Phytophthora fragariaefolia TaxID=1490495 RepID=A0A9W6XR98_9STRA|nr:unnamed protein product [Phytophthora fragariaefolia]
MKTGKVNLREQLGRETIEIHDVFASAPAATEFLRAYAFNENKSIVQIGHSGHKNVWGCKSEAFCTWEVSLSKKRSTKRANKKLAFCPEGAWFVSSAELVHSPSCDSVGEASAEILATLPGLEAPL